MQHDSIKEQRPGHHVPVRLILATLALAAATAASSLPVLAKEQANQSANPDQATDDNKIRCRKIEVTGSLVRKTKVCKTVAEWRAIGDKGNRNVRDLVESGQVCAGGPACNGS